MSLRFAHIALSCADPAAIERFYTRYLGFERSRVCDLGGGEQIVFLRGPGAHLELFRAEGKRPAPPVLGDGPHYPGMRHMAFQVDDVEALLARIGPEVPVTLGPMGFDAFIPGWRTAWISDPEGNIIEISQGYVDDTGPAA